MSDHRLIHNRFEIDKIIGRGGNGNVYRAIDLDSKQPVAIKSLKSDILLEEPTLLARFLQEAELLRQLNHPNIIKIIENVHEGDEYFLVMDYVEGGSLKDLLAKTPQLPVEQVLQIGLDIADALTRAHRLKIIHRDIKPSNILVDKQGRPYLTDFGVARIADSGIITKTGDLIGTTAYLSPEVLTGETADPRADIWSLGIVFFEMMAGRRPFDEEQQVAILVSILNKPLPDLQRLRPDAPSELVQLITQMLEKDRDKRIASVRQVGVQLETLIEGLDTKIRKSLPSGGVNMGVSRFPPATATESLSRRVSTEEEKAILNFKRRIGCMIILLLAALTLIVLLLALLAFSQSDSAYISAPVFW